MKVAEFINPTTKVWDKGKLESYIPPEEMQKICNIPISLVGAQDKLIWRHTSSGKYTVNSGYGQKVINSMKGNPDSPSCSFIPSKSTWNRLWKVKAMPKVRMFVWKAVKNWVSCRANLFRRKCASSPQCPICNSASETIDRACVVSLPVE